VLKSQAVKQFLCL